MDWIKIRQKIDNSLKKYKYIFLIILVGIVLMVLPSQTSDKRSDEQNEVKVDTSVDLNAELSKILSTVKGAGRVEVMLTVACGEEVIYQLDEDSSKNQNGESKRVETVVISDSNRNESGLIRQINSPVYLGAIIVCDGADDPNVQLAIVNAVSKATGLGADKISVLKMK